MGSLPPKNVKDECQSRGSWMRWVGRFFTNLFGWGGLGFGDADCLF